MWNLGFWKGLNFSPGKRQTSSCSLSPVAIPSHLGITPGFLQRTQELRKEKVLAQQTWLQNNNLVHLLNRLTNLRHFYLQILAPPLSECRVHRGQAEGRVLASVTVLDWVYEDTYERGKWKWNERWQFKSDHYFKLSEAELNNKTGICHFRGFSLQDFVRFATMSDSYQLSTDLNYR